MNLSRKTKSLLTYAACLMLAFATPMSVYAEEPASAPETPLPVETQQPPQPPLEQAAPVVPESSSSTVPTAPPATTSATTEVQPEMPAPVQPTVEKSNNKKANSPNWQWDPVKNKYVRVKTSVVDPASDVADKGAPTSELSVDTTTAIANALDSLATSGSAKVHDNGTAGSATSGNAVASATIVNGVNSSMSNANNTEAATFVKDIIGDVNGDIMLQPILLKAMLEANIAQQNTSTATSKNKSSISNTANLTAMSGNAAVKDNRHAGNATSGSADTVANVVNMVNSMVSANQSFMGTVNIYGNLNGDILIAPDFIPQMIASNGSAAKSAGSGVSIVSTRDTQEIVNNVSLAANSGNALVRDNVQAGNATSGDAATNLVIFNLSGHEIVASNSLLVFINVLGAWVGVIVDAPQGATAAAVGSGVTQSNIQPSMAIDTTSDSVITNNLNLSSTSGNAVVADNGIAGNATSGRATASANIANISNSSLGLSGWFGVLFINVFGSWNGSFGIDTAAGNSSPQTATVSPSEQAVIKFIPREQRTDRSTIQRLKIVDPVQQSAGEDASPSVTQASAAEVRGASDAKSDIPTQQSFIEGRKELNVPLTAISLILIVGSGYVLRKYLF